MPWISFLWTVSSSNLFKQGYTEANCSEIWLYSFLHLHDWLGIEFLIENNFCFKFWKYDSIISQLLVVLLRSLKSFWFLILCKYCFLKNFSESLGELFSVIDCRFSRQCSLVWVCFHVFKPRRLCYSTWDVFSFFHFYLSSKVQAQVCYWGKVCHEVCCTDHFITQVLSLVPFSCFFLIFFLLPFSTLWKTLVCVVLPPVICPCVLII